MSVKELPNGWTWAHLGDLGTWYGGGTPSKKRPDYWEQGSIPWLSPKDMRSEVLSTTENKITKTALEESATRLVPEQSVAFVTRSGILSRRFPVALVPFCTTLNQDMKAILPQEGVTPKWIAWYLRYQEQTILDSFRKSGTTVSSISTGKLKNLPVPIPPKVDQLRIVETLEDLLSRHDKAIQEILRAQRKLNAFRRSVLLELVPEVSPSTWSVATVEEAGSIQLGRQRHPDWHQGPEMRPYLRVANVFEGRIDTTDVMSMDFSGVFERYRLESGDILLNEGQSPHLVGRPALYRGTPPNVAFTNSLLRFRPRSDVLPEWALLVFRRHLHAGRFKREARITTNIAHLSANRLKSIEFPIPPVSEQRNLIETSANLMSGADSLWEELSRGLVRSDKLRRKILAKAFAGLLTPKESSTGFPVHLPPDQPFQQELPL